MNLGEHASTTELSGSIERNTMQLETELWREASRHEAIESFVESVAPSLLGLFRADLVLVRRIEGGNLRLRTVAAGFVGSLEEPEHAITSLTARALDELRDLVTNGDLLAGRSSDSMGPARYLVPEGVTGSFLFGGLRSDQGAEGTLLLVRKAGRPFEALELETVARVIEPFSIALANDRRHHDAERIRAAAEADRHALLTRLDRVAISESIVGADAGLRGVMTRVEQVAPTDASVMIFGETGSGKEVVARAIHARSRRADGPIVRVNCGAIPPELVDSELFGHEKGSFTGAVQQRQGWFERADGGTLFLDEIAELPLAAQVRLLRVLQEGTLERVGGHRTIHVDVRIVAATHRDLGAMVERGEFREDLWYRIGVFPIHLPALRDHLEDLPALATHFATRSGKRLGVGRLVPSEEDLRALASYDWPGNVRELGAVIERAAILGGGRKLDVHAALSGGSANGAAGSSGLSGPFGSFGSFGSSSSGASARDPRPTRPSNDEPFPTLDRAMADHIERALTKASGRIEGPDGAAKLLDINPHTLRSRMRKLGIDWQRFRRPGDGGDEC